MAGYTLGDMRAVQRVLDKTDLPMGVGDGPTRDGGISACSIAAIRLALYGELDDEIPDCMSIVLGKWIITVQDDMGFEQRNHRDWKHLLPLAAGTGRRHERERLELIMQYMKDNARFAAEVDREDFQADMERLDELVATLPGFPKHFELGKPHSDTWIRVIESVISSFDAWMDPSDAAEEMYGLLDKLVAVGWEVEESEERSTDVEKIKQNLEAWQNDQFIEAILGDNEEVQ